MILDLVIAGIMIVCMSRGFAKGFVYTFIHTLGWLAAAAFAWFSAAPLAGILADGTIGTSVNDGLTEKFAVSEDAVDTSLAGLPDIISGGISTGAGEASELFISMLTTTLLTVISYSAIMLAAGLLLKLLVRPACRRHGGGILNTSDRMLGLTAGFVEGLVLVFAFLAILMVIIGIAGEDASASIVSALRSSFITETLYDNNLLLLVTGGFFS